MFVGRLYLYGLAAGGQAGIRSVLKILREKTKRTLILSGCPSTVALNCKWVMPVGSYWPHGAPPEHDRRAVRRHQLGITGNSTYGIDLSSKWIVVVPP